MRTVQARRGSPESASYTAALLNQGLPAILAKVAEESREVVEAANEAPGSASDQHLIHEVADLVYHLVVMLACRDLDWNQVEHELERRAGTSGLVEKQSRRQPRDS